jgi:hypothetical protein
MKIVLDTQHRENYGAHDWDGTGECPQYWKSKGGSTYVIENVTIGQAMDPEFWARVRDMVSRSDVYFEEYVIGDQLLDDCDKVEHESWDAPYVCKDIETGVFSQISQGDHFAEPVQAVRSMMGMEDGRLLPQGVEYMIDGEWVSYKRGCEIVAAYREQEAA